MKFKTKNLKSKKKKKGFTLIELVAVLAIIAILSAAFVPKMGNYITEAKKVAVLNEAKLLGYKKIYLKTELVNYYEKFGAIYIENLNDKEKLYYIEL